MMNLALVLPPSTVGPVGSNVNVPESKVSESEALFQSKGSPIACLRKIPAGKRLCAGDSNNMVVRTPSGPCHPFRGNPRRPCNLPHKRSHPTWCRGSSYRLVWW